MHTTPPPPQARLSAGKVIAPALKALAAADPAAAYSSALADARRARISEAELCDIVWEFHFLEAAGEWLVALDPFHNGSGPRLQRTFSPDGSCDWRGAVPVWLVDEMEDWTFRWQMMGSRNGVKGQFVRVRVLGIPPWPSMEVTRSADWGWELHNEW